MELSRSYSAFSSTNDLNLSPSRKRTITKGKTINPHDDSEPCHSATTVNMVSQSTVSCQTRNTEFYCLNNEEGILRLILQLVLIRTDGRVILENDLWA